MVHALRGYLQFDGGWAALHFVRHRAQVLHACQRI